MQENKTFFCFIIFLFTTFQRKLGILIPDLYLYVIKIQTNIKQKIDRKIHRKVIDFFKRIFLEWALPDPTSLGRCCPAQLTVESELIHSPMFNCKKIEDTRSGKRRRRRRREEREADMAAVQSFMVAMLWRKAMVRSEEQFFFFSVQRHQSLFFSPPRLFLFSLVFFFLFLFLFYASIPFLCSLLFFFPFVSLIFQSRPLLSMMSL